MGRLGNLAFHLILCIMVLCVAEPTIVECLRSTDTDTDNIESMTYDAWMEFCDSTIRETAAKEERAEARNTVVCTKDNSKNINAAFRDFKKEFKSFKLECDRLKKLYGKECHNPKADKADAKNKLEIDANRIGRIILGSSTAMQLAYDVYVVVRKCEEPGNNYRGAIAYLKERMNANVSDGTSYMLNIAAVLAPVLLMVLF